MTHALHASPLRCSRDYCGVDLLTMRTEMRRYVVHPYSPAECRWHCPDEGRAYRHWDLGFAGWWMPREEFRERFGW